jgi:hypothetical protein
VLLAKLFIDRSPKLNLEVSEDDFGVLITDGREKREEPEGGFSFERWEDVTNKFCVFGVDGWKDKLLTSESD